MTTIPYSPSMRLQLATDYTDQMKRINTSEYTGASAFADTTLPYRPSKPDRRGKHYDWINGKHALKKKIPAGLIKAFETRGGVILYGGLSSLPVVEGMTDEKLKGYIRELIYMKLLVVA
jgi:hypothetical protein